MSSVIKQFGQLILEGGLWNKFFQKQTPGKRIVPAQAKDNDAKAQLRIDAGETINGKKNVYLQVNSQAKNESLVKWRKKHGSHANLAVGQIDENTPPEKQEEAARELVQSMMAEARRNV
ncbi:hypothetical protein K461DRAFT_282403 [Myriangium duriaei CBS 260.36]|uniref:Uncharacterized protein n=1 Tax=Myriangium duriaei CBS 260.36 TaxID=1168546 RepID=A0A9P4IY12_9PEZI|nr:hypothetical protein K461DRAFT_282403 [Myriangium duriaei CBS 260.36]